ncbi:MAG: gene transfer agent family protein [Alphaproteobacteria bacterium]|nr:gene transfer agent family protein [Alphaproteobacteria bacterium]
MVNAARGEVALELNGAAHRLCLTLGALAEIEAGLGAQGLAALHQRLSQPSARDLLVVLGALLRGGGAEMRDEEIARMPLDLEAAATAIAATFAAAGLAAAQKQAKP